MTLWNFNQREKLCGISWTGIDEPNEAFVYSCCFAKGKEDFIVASCLGKNEVQVFEKDIVYKPTWTITGLSKGIYTCDIGPNGD